MNDTDWIDEKLAHLSAWASALKEQTERLERDVCAGGLWDRVNECQFKGMRGTFNGTALQTFNMAGRVMLTITDGRDQQVTFLGADKNNCVGRAIRIGLHSVEGDHSTIERLINDVLDKWPKNTDEQRRVFQRDDSATVAWRRK